MKINSQKILLLDIGNTRIKWGIFDNHNILINGAVNVRESEQDNFLSLYQSFPSGIEKAVASSVLDSDISIKLKKTFKSFFGFKIEFIETDENSHNVINGYDEPLSLGVDRWVAMIAARNEFKKDVMIIDMGTAITIDLIDKYGTHRGGKILPGFKLMSEALNKNTSNIQQTINLHNIEKKDIQFWGKDTRNVIISGITSAISGAIQVSLDELNSNGEEAVVIITGGDSEFFKDYLDRAYKFRPNLVLSGLAVLASQKH